MLTPQPETQEQGRRQAELQSRAGGAQNDAAPTQADWGAPQRPVHQAVPSPKVMRWSEGGTGFKQKRQGLGSRAFGNKSEGIKKKNLCVKRQRLLHQLPEDESGFPIVARPPGKEAELQLLTPPRPTILEDIRETLTGAAQHLTQYTPISTMRALREEQQEGGGTRVSERGGEYSPSVPSGSRAREACSQ